MAYIFQTRTDGYGQPCNAQALRNGQERFETAPAYAGDTDAPDVDGLTDEVIAVIGRACRANSTNSAACADLLRTASAMLAALADDVEAA